MNRYRWPVLDDVYDTALEGISMPQVPVSYYTTGGEKRARD